MAPYFNRAAIRRAVRAIEPWYDWGRIGVERMEPLRTGEISIDGDVRFVELQWLGLHVALQIGRTPSRSG
jgi:hypothetical protein